MEIIRNKDRRFTWGFLCMVPLLVAAYGFLFQWGIIAVKPVIPRSYKHWLLENTPPPRILIDSGSNAYHAVNGTFMESLTGYPVLILSDHAGSSLEDKITRLERFARPGDQIILPLEWSFYIHEELTDLHLTTSMEEVNYYFHTLPSWRRWWRAYETPWMLTLSRLLDGKWRQEDSYLQEKDRLRLFEHHHLANDPSGGATAGEGLKDPYLATGCDVYILAPLLKTNLPLSSRFQSSMKRVARLRERGIEVVVTPPVVVGDDCYRVHGERLDLTRNAALALFEELGIPHLKDHFRYAYPIQSFLNTHYHIDSEARDHFTPMLVADLVGIGWLKPGNANQTLREMVSAQIVSAKHQLVAHKLPPWSGERIELADPASENRFYYGQSWYEPDPLLRWAIGDEAEIIFRPKPGASWNLLRINANYHAGSAPTRIYLNGIETGTHDFSESADFFLSQPISHYLDKDGLIRLRLETPGASTPHSVSGSSDHRIIKLGIHAIEMHAIKLPLPGCHP